ncbi:Nibrin [Portunus trituberculatus]|uniref:Nibrin n=1 Tax=Portunus trituberculatus TaxID=210409 RepID=A0A5B7HK52_PORTR|nr:Nibrin [Portunus trituberculatus]
MLSECMLSHLRLHYSVSIFYLLHHNLQCFSMCLILGFKQHLDGLQVLGGKVELLTEDNHEKVVSGKFILIRMKTLMPNTLYSKTLDLLKKHGLRAVPESDIGLAIVFVSTKSHCNSAYLGPTSFFRRSSSTQSLEKPKIFATETQSTEFSVSLTGPKVVPDSGEQQPSTSAQSEMAPPKVPIKRCVFDYDGF